MQEDDFERAAVADENNSTEQMVIVRTKMSVGGPTHRKRESLWSNSSSHSGGPNNRYGDADQNINNTNCIKFEELKVAEPLSTKN